MRRAAWISLVAVPLLLLACVGAGIAVQTRQGHRLAPPGSAHVQVHQTGPFHTLVTYQLPQGRSVYDLRDHMRRLGWQRINMATNVQQLSLVFVRSDPQRVIRDFATVTLSADRRYATVEVQRCVRLYRWTDCF